MAGTAPPNKQRNIRKRRKLQELYTRGVELRFEADGVHLGPFKDDDGNDIPANDETVAMFITPPSPLQREQALREGQAARQLAILKAKREEDSFESTSARLYVTQMTPQQLTEYVLSVDEGDRMQEAQREVLKRDEWEDFTALQDLMRKWEEAGSPVDDPEWEPLLERDRDFGRQVREETMRLKSDSKDSLALVPRNELEERAFSKRIELEASQAFLGTYEAQMVMYSCRDSDDHQELFFESPEEIRDLPEEVQKAIGNAINDFIQDVREAKNSQGVAPGSDSSVLPDAPETSEASTPEVPSEPVKSRGSSKSQLSTV